MAGLGEQQRVDVGEGAVEQGGEARVVGADGFGAGGPHGRRGDDGSGVVHGQ